MSKQVLKGYIFLNIQKTPKNGRIILLQVNSFRIGQMANLLFLALPFGNVQHEMLRVPITKIISPESTPPCLLRMLLRTYSNCSLSNRDLVLRKKFFSLPTKKSSTTILSDLIMFCKSQTAKELSIKRHTFFRFSIQVI